MFDEELFGLATKIFAKVRDVLIRNERDTYYTGFDKSKFISFYKCLLASESYNDLFNIPLAKCQASNTNHTFQSIHDKYCDESEMKSIHELMKLIESRIYLIKQTTKIKHALLNDGQKTIQFEEQFNIVFELISDKSVFSLLTNPEQAAMFVDFITSKIFIETLFEKLWDGNLTGHNIVGLDFLKNFFIHLLDEDILYYAVRSFGYIQCPQHITTSKIDVFNSLRSYVRELFKASAFFKKFEIRMRNEEKPRKVKFEAATVTLSNTPTMIAELKWFPNLKQMTTHSVRMPIVQQKLCFFLIITFNTFIYLLEKKYLNHNGILYYFGIIPEMTSDKIYTPSIHTIDNFLKKLDLHLDKEFLTRIRVAWYQFFYNCLRRKMPSLEHFDHESVAIILIAAQSKVFWKLVLENHVTDEDTLEMITSYIVDFISNVKKDTLDGTMEEIDERIDSIQDRLHSSMEQAKYIASLAQPLLPKMMPYCSKTIETFENFTKKVKFEQIRKLVYTFKGRVR